MSSNYKGIIFDRLKNKKPNAKKPEWFDKENNVEEITKEELKSMEWLDE